MNPFDDTPEEQDTVQASIEGGSAQAEESSESGAAADAVSSEANASDVESEDVTPESNKSSNESEAPEEIPEAASVDPAFADEDAEPADSAMSAESEDAPEVEASSEAVSDADVAEETRSEPDPNLIPGQDENPLMNWFIIHTYSGFENKVSESFKTRADAFGFAHRVGQILIPTEEVVEMRNGKKVTSKRLLYPGYVLVQMEMDDDLWHQVKNTPRVTGFVGGGGQPVPLTATEVNSILYRQTEAAERPRPKLTYEKNETVRIIDGPFANFQGKVDEINSERNTLRVMVTIFGRSTPVELDFLQVEKMA
jgi:transcriptional antiterminator NusG